MITGLGATTVWATNWTAGITYNFGSSFVMGTIQLQAESEYQDQTATLAHIRQYVQNGSPFTGDWPVIWGPNVTSITYELTSTGGSSRALGLTYFFG